MIIKCCKNSGELEFSEKEGLSQFAGKEYFRATIRSKQLSSFTDVYAFDPFDSNLVRFFEDLAENWKGFDGEKEWSSLEGEFSLTCTSDNLGHFALEVTIRNNEDTRCARKTIYIESGQLENISLEARNFFSISRV
ncbi:MAG: DUF6228 family protein [Pyrinomonadaceae bacterium]